MKKNNEHRTTYTYYRWDSDLKREVPVVITAGTKDGVTEEHILWLEEADHKEALQERYAEENRDYSTENQKVKYLRGDDGVADDPINELADNRTNPDHFLYEDVKENPQVQQLLELMEKLTPKQIDLIYAHFGERRYLADIAAEEGCTPQAVTNRKNKIINRLKKLFAELDEQK